MNNLIFTPLGSGVYRVCFKVDLDNGLKSADCFVATIHPVGYIDFSTMDEKGSYLACEEIAEILDFVNSL